MKGKIFTVGEANCELPLLSRIVDDIVAMYPVVTAVLAQLEAAKQKLERLESQSAITQQEKMVDELDKLVSEKLDRFKEIIQEAESLGAVVKDYEDGCVDFYGEVGGEIVYYCWKRGEKTVGHFHGLHESFEKRRLIPVSVAQR